LQSGIAVRIFLRPGPHRDAFCLEGLRVADALNAADEVLDGLAGSHKTATDGAHVLGCCDGREGSVDG
jgi:hypothetical protein